MQFYAAFGGMIIHRSERGSFGACTCRINCTLTFGLGAVLGITRNHTMRLWHVFIAFAHKTRTPQQINRQSVVYAPKLARCIHASYGAQWLNLATA